MISSETLVASILRIAEVAASRLVGFLIGIDFSYYVALFLGFWWLRRQPRTKGYSCHDHQHQDSVPNLSSEDVSCDSSSSLDDHASNDRNALNDQLWGTEVPGATMQERRRFYIGCKGDLRAATKKLKNYLSWREKHREIEDEIRSTLELTGDEDMDDWRIATAIAMQVEGETADVTKVPQIGCMHKLQDGCTMTDNEGNRIIQIIPGRMDGRVLGFKTYALISALYIDRKLDPKKFECVTVLIDVRAGVGWPNPNGAQLLPFIKQTASLLLSLFPERLGRCYVYPLPPAFEWVWRLVHRCLDSMTAAKIGVFSGPATIHSPPPVESMENDLDDDIITTLEDYRVSCFISD